MNESSFYIYVIDDDIDIKNLMLEAFSLYNIKATGSHRCDSAISYLTSVDMLPKLIFLDLNLPHFDGYWFCNEIKKSPRLAALPIFLLSADNSAQKAAKELGLAGYLKKPFALEELIAIVKQYLA